MPRLPRRGGGKISSMGVVKRGPRAGRGKAGGPRARRAVGPAPDSAVANDMAVDWDDERPAEPEGGGSAAELAALLVAWHAAGQLLDRCPQPQQSEWGRRVGQLLCDWAARAAAFALAMLRRQAAPPADAKCATELCVQPATTRCFSCAASGRPLCAGCDESLHRGVHKHRRQQFDRELASWRDLEQAAGESADGTVKASRGGFECGKCCAVVFQAAEDFIAVGAWPSTVKDPHTIVDELLLEVYDAIRLFCPSLSKSAFLKALTHMARKMQPMLILPDINVNAFKNAFDSWKHAQEDVRRGVQGVDDAQCPACAPRYGESAEVHAHGDGNIKLSTYQRKREPDRPFHYVGGMFMPDARVQLTLRVVQDLVGRRVRMVRPRPGLGGAPALRRLAPTLPVCVAAAQPKGNTCGGEWEAASNKSRSRAVLDITGRFFAVCRHCIPVAAANMINTGERFEYLLHLAASSLLPRGLVQLHGDVMCKWRKWAPEVLTKLTTRLQLDGDVTPADADALAECERVATCGAKAAAAAAEAPRGTLVAHAAALVAVLAALKGVRMVMSQMHGATHSDSCQVLNMPGMHPGCAMTVGEEAEQFFAYLSLWRFITRNQSAAGSTNTLHEASVHWSRVKIWGQAEQLSGRLTKAEAARVVAAAELARLLDTLDEREVLDAFAAQGVEPASRPKQQFIQLLREALHAKAKAEDNNKTLKEQLALIETFAEAVRQRDAAIIASQGDAPSSPLLAHAQSVLAGAVEAPRTPPQLVDKDEHEQRYDAAVDYIDNNLKPTVRAFVVATQLQLEGHAQQLQKLSAKIEAAEPRKQQKYYDASAKEMKKLNALVERYNALVDCDRQCGTYLGMLEAEPFKDHLSAADVSAGRFPWATDRNVQEGSLLHVFGVARALKVVQADNKVERLQEEVSLLLREMARHLQYWQREVARLDRLAQALQMGGAAALKAAGYKLLPGVGRFQPSEEQLAIDARAASGALSMVGVAREEAFRHLRRAQQQFEKVVLPNVGGGGALGGERDEGEGDVDKACMTDADMSDSSSEDGGESESESDDFE
ncbi:hypothetical protein HT031_005045 [Scenedesmus sp. PABB004]|nr:hypothetical protein HT031_005045 [Scenedesmus sp. PABB004]